MDIKKYLVLVRAYSIVDVWLLLLVARTLAISYIPFSIIDIIAGINILCVWGMLTLSLEAKHRHAYRGHISYFVPIILALTSTIISAFFNIQAIIFLLLTCLFTYLYIKKETNPFWGATSSLWRGLYQAALFFFSLSLYKSITNFSISDLTLGAVILLLHLSRNLIADVRDVAFDRLTFTVQFGIHASYYVSLLCYTIASLLLFFSFSSLFILAPVLTISSILLFYDDGFMLHRISIMVTSFTFINIIFLLQGIPLIYSNLLFMGIVSNFLFYEKVARPSNPVPTVRHEVRFLFK